MIPLQPFLDLSNSNTLNIPASRFQLGHCDGRSAAILRFCMNAFNQRMRVTETPRGHDEALPFRGRG